MSNVAINSAMAAPVGESGDEFPYVTREELERAAPANRARQFDEMIRRVLCSTQNTRDGIEWMTGALSARRAGASWPKTTSGMANRRNTHRTGAASAALGSTETSNE